MNKLLFRMRKEWFLLPLAVLLCVPTFIDTPYFYASPFLPGGQKVAALIVVCFGLWSVLRWRMCVRALRSGWPLALLALVVAASALWFQKPFYPLRSLAETMLGLMIAAELSVSRQCRLYGVAFGLIVMLCYVTIIFFPQMGITSGIMPEDIKHFGTWRGIFGHKNTLGQYAALAALFYLHSLIVSRRYVWLKTGMLLASFILLAQSHSLSAWVAAAASLIALGLLCLESHQRLFVLLTGGGTALMVGLLVLSLMFPALVPEWMAKGADLSRRTYIWGEVLPHALQAPWFGHGHDFWFSPHNTQITERLRFSPYSSHNGFLETFVMLGLIGLVLLVFALARDVLRSSWPTTNTKGLAAYPFHGWGCMLLAYLIVLNMAESRFLSPFNLCWILWTTYSFSPKAGNVPEDSALRHLCQSPLRLLCRWFVREHWVVGLVSGMSYGDLVQRTGDITIPATALRWLSPPADTWQADPFAASVDGNHYLFAERVDSSGKGSIVRYSLPDIAAAAPVLTEAFHLSYPCTYVENGKLYCLPEMQESGVLSLYRWEGEGFVHDAMVMDTPLADPTLFRHNGQYWILGSRADQLLGFYSPHLRGPWQAHTMNPLATGTRYVRSAGAVCTVENALYRPAQDGTAGYGRAIDLMKITALSAQQFMQVPLSRITIGSGSPYPHGCHTLNTYADGLVIDAKIRSFHPFAWYGKYKEKQAKAARIRLHATST